MKLNLSANLDLEKFMNPELALKAVEKVVYYHTADMEKRAMRKVPYKTGHLKRSIGLEVSAADLKGTVGASAEYAGYVEKGTRFMSPRPYLEPALNEVRPGFIEDMERIAAAGGKDD